MLPRHAACACLAGGDARHDTARSQNTGKVLMLTRSVHETCSRHPFLVRHRQLLVCSLAESLYGLKTAFRWRMARRKPVLVSLVCESKRSTLNCPACPACVQPRVGGGQASAHSCTAKAGCDGVDVFQRCRVAHPAGADRASARQTPVLSKRRRQVAHSRASPGHAALPPLAYCR